MKTLLSCAAVLATVLAGSDAFAQKTGFAVDRFEPAERGSQFYAMDTLDIRGNFRPAVGTLFAYGYQPLVVYDAQGDVKSAIVRHQIITPIGASMVFVDRLRIGVNLPIAAYQDGEDSVVDGQTYSPATKPAVGDLRLAADVRLYGTKGDLVTVAGGLRGWLPTGVRSQFTSDGSFRFAPQVMVAGDFGRFTYAARTAFQFRPDHGAYYGSSLGSELSGGIAAGMKSTDGRLVTGPELYASTVVTGNAFFKQRGSPAEILWGVHYDFGAGVRGGGGIGAGLSQGYGSPEVRALFSLEWAPGHGDPVPAQPTMEAVAAKLDSDADGIPDAVDACWDVAGVNDPDPKKNGCPADRDADGITDLEDACPDVPGIRTYDIATNGCPARAEAPAVVAIVTPPPTDTDEDGILDTEDACPTVPGPHHTDPKKNGCPLVQITGTEIKILEQVKFKFNSAEILRESDTILEAVRDTLAKHPEFAKVRIEGHTDNVGAKDYNKSLSQRRAASVTAWMTERGIDKARLSYAGYGMEEPIDTNATTEGRANNRRVAFTILDTKERTANR